MFQRHELIIVRNREGTLGSHCEITIGFSSAFNLIDTDFPENHCLEVVMNVLLLSYGMSNVHFFY